MSSSRIRPEYLRLLLASLLAATLMPLQLAAPLTDADPADPIPISIPIPIPQEEVAVTMALGLAAEDPHTEESFVARSEAQAETEVDGQRIDCKLTFDAATMDSLACQHNKGQGHTQAEAEEPGQDSDSVNKPETPEDKQNEELQRHLKRPDSQPIYELQLVVWPSDIEDGDDFSPPLATTTSKTPTTIATPTEQNWQILYEEPVTVFPQMGLEEGSLLDDSGPSSTTASPPSTTGTPQGPVSHPTGTYRPQQPIDVVQSFHVIHPNGTEEFKVVMKNGLVNYQKIYTKRVGDRLINVQVGYHSVLLPGPKNQIQTQYYIADERGYNIYKTEVHNQQPRHLHYKATKSANM
ncbi:hypothetical protein KR018_011792 [Drosophila ironensis]|nr:hypothetical protein KR018_011792 [Drosophila ironensis]